MIAKNALFFLLLAVGFTTKAQDSNYKKAWDALNQNKIKEATEYLSKASLDAGSIEDAYITNVYLQTYNSTERSITDFAKNFYVKSADPYPYIYALWFNDAVLGDYGKKTAQCQLALADKIIADPRAPGTLVAAANYQRGMDALFSANFKKAQVNYDAVGSLRNWQYAGPFENLSQSGFDKSYGPLEHPEATATFKSLTNAEIKWFTPAVEIKDGWTPVSYQYSNNSTAVVFAQNFVNSPADQDVYCSAGFTGSAKVWVNDELIIAEPKERITELDAYGTKVSLKKGANRVLVQLGFTSTAYPNFSIRFTDEHYNIIPNLTGSSMFSSYPKQNNGVKKDILPLFAEAFFKDKITRAPGNLVNYLLLSDAYLRSNKLLEARNLLDEALTQSPNNPLLVYKMIQVLTKENNRTLLLEEIEKLKQLDPDGFMVLRTNISDFYENEKYEDGQAELDKMIRLYGESETTNAFKVMMLVKEKKFDELLKEGERLFKKYPDDSKLVEMMYNIKKEVNKDPKGALQLYENYLKTNFHYDAWGNYATHLTDAGKTDKALDLKLKLVEIFPYSATGYSDLSRYYFTMKNYEKAKAYVAKALAIAPYDEGYWELTGDINNEQKNVPAALEAYNQSLRYDPNQYEIISKIRKLNGKTEITKLFSATNIDSTIKEDKPANAKNTDYGYYYILDQKDVVLYPGGATEEYYTTILKITNDKGVDKYKESSISYNNSQSLLIEKAEVVKKNQSKIEGERSDNQVVFTNLEAGDIIVFKYRLQTYSSGRLAKEYWDKYYCNGQIYSALVKYNILVPSGEKLNYTLKNSTLQPVVKDVEDFKEYSWTMEHPEPVKDEPLMPVLADVGVILHVSTLSTWNDIADWYSDVSNNKAEQDYELIALYKKLFPADQKNKTQFQKARVIYDYIEKNIRYSSVSFRQSALVPQRASATLTTRLGDCKDLSSLFVTLAHMAGIEAQMVLVDTRDNGEKQIALPSVDFNHCIAKATLDKKSYYIELTDNYLPFTSLPNDLNGAIILEIPKAGAGGNSSLQLLKAPNRTKDMVKRVIDIRPSDTDLKVNVKSVYYGNPSSGLRNSYLNMDNDKQMIDVEKSVANGYKNNVKLEKVSFKDLDKMDDSVSYEYSYKVKNEIAHIGSLQTFRVIFPDVIASLDNFSADKREYPVEYWRYENTDNYLSTVNITAPAGKKFVEVPKSQTFTFKDMKFSMTYTLKAPGLLIINRNFTDGRTNIAAADYNAFKDFFEKIVNAEQNFIAYQ